MISGIAFMEWLKMIGVVSVISALLATINPFANNFLFGFFIIWTMFGGTAIPFHIYAMKKHRVMPEHYSLAGAICGAAVGVLYTLVQPHINGDAPTPIFGIILFASGGAFLGSLCGLVFWSTAVSRTCAPLVHEEDKAREAVERKVLVLNFLGFFFGYTLVSVATEKVCPVLLREEIAGPLMTTYGVASTFLVLPLAFMLANAFIVRSLLRGSIAALFFLLFEAAVVIARSLYSLPIDGFGAGIIFAAVCFFILRSIALQHFTERQKTAFKFAMIGIVALLTAHILITGVATYNRQNFDNQRSISGEWHARFQPKNHAETGAEAEKLCSILEGRLREQQRLPSENSLLYATQLLEQANVHFSSAWDISESRVVYYFKSSANSDPQTNPASIEEAVLRHVLTGAGIDDYADWKAKYGLFFESSYDIFYTPREKVKLNGPYLTKSPDNRLAFSVPLKDPLHIQNFWTMTTLQSPPGYLSTIMQEHGYDFEDVELWDAVRFSYVYDLNGFIPHLLFSDVYFFTVTLEYLARRENDGNITSMTLQKIDCSYPHRGDLYDRPEGVSYAPPSYPGFRRCHRWQASMYCPGPDKPLKHETNICRQLGTPLPDCPHYHQPRLSR